MDGFYKVSKKLSSKKWVRNRLYKCTLPYVPITTTEDIERLCNQFRLMSSRAIILRWCIARNAAVDSAMLTPKTKSGTRACCEVVMRAERLRLSS